IKFSVSNFLSFKDSQSLSMQSNKSNRLKHHMIVSKNNRILKSALLFGANASGKSNFIKAIDFARELVLKGDTSRVVSDKKYFRIDSNNKNKPGIFQFDIELNDRYYSYGFALSYITNEVLGEWLIDITTTENIIFSRTLNENKEEYSTESNLTINGNNQKTRFNIYLNDFKKKEMSNLLILSDLAKRTSDIEECHILRSIMKWFSSIVVIYPNTHNDVLKVKTVLANDEIFDTFLDGLDTGIEQSIIKDIDFKNALKDLPDSLKDDLIKDVLNSFNKDINRTVIFNMNGNVFFIKGEKTSTGEIKPITRTIVFNHGNNDDYFEFKDESDGTRRIFDLLPLLSIENEDSLILIDELDQSLHTKLAQLFYELFMNSCKGIKKQLIFTTHDILLMDLDLERQDEIWFIEREKDHSSKLYSLSDYKVRSDTKSKLGNDYLLGRYGAIPVLDKESCWVGDDDE
ncbi:MAG: ATP-binding protein, partial [Spirochaetaceae bacterium]|nr:ATP-binding protein [Spirochaetaceae bacterium]